MHFCLFFSPPLYFVASFPQIWWSKNCFRNLTSVSKVVIHHIYIRPCVAYLPTIKKSNFYQQLCVMISHSEYSNYRCKVQYSTITALLPCKCNRRIQQIPFILIITDTFYNKIYSQAHMKLFSTITKNLNQTNEEKGF